MSNTTVPFKNTFMQSHVVVGTAAADRGNNVELVEAEHATLVTVHAGGVTIYMNVATAQSLATQILRVIDKGCDPLWETEPMTGEEEDRWSEDIRAGAIGGNA